jgi:lincosamide nucleotidyltransferase A/C/D/E
MPLAERARAAYHALDATPLRRLLHVAPMRRLRARVRRRIRLRHALDAPQVLEIVAALQAAGTRPSLVGGWGVDALLGEQTRRHADLDIVVDDSDLGAVEATLRELGFAFVAELTRPAGHALLSGREVLRDPEGREVDVHCVSARRWESLADGDVFTWGAIDGTPVPCISAAMQEQSHRGYELEIEDLQDLALLERRFRRAPPSSSAGL